MRRAAPAIAENVHYDGASAYEWEALNERVFVERVLLSLRETMGADFAAHSFYILSSHDPAVVPESAADPSPGKVLLFISEETGALPPPDLQSRYGAIFKAYLPREPGGNVFPFNLGYVGDSARPPIRPVEERRTTVFFSGVLTPGRRPMYRALHPVYRRLPPQALDLALRRARLGRRLVPADLSSAIPRACIRFTPAFKAGLSGEDYARLLADAQVALCPPGALGPETFRHIESVRAGAVVVTQPLPATHFYRGAPFVTVADWRDGPAQVRNLLGDPARLSELHDATRAWWDSVCSEAATASFVKQCLSGL